MIASRSQVLIVLLCLVSSADGTPLTPDEAKKFLGEFNQGRIAMAENFQIANMHALSWDKEMTDIMNGVAETAAKLDCGNSGSGGKEPDLNGRPVMFFKQTPFLEKVRDKAMKELVEGGWPEKLLQALGLEVALHPLQTKIGCARVACKYQIPNTAEKIETEMMCIMGPHKTFEKSDIVNGEPGSECESSKDENGLCLESGEKAEIAKDVSKSKVLKEYGAKDAKGSVGVEKSDKEKSDKEKSDKEKSSAGVSIVLSLILLAVQLAL